MSLVRCAHHLEPPCHPKWLQQIQEIGTHQEPPGQVQLPMRASVQTGHV